MSACTTCKQQQQYLCNGECLDCRSAARHARAGESWEDFIREATTALERADKALDNITGWSGGGGNWPAQDAHVRVQAALLVLRETKAEGEQG